ncbi:MAG: substrate-binding domain-containing protein [Chloroflexota bacterium]|nr:substrate-binding domain-containing protein [Chloroflexota bacterium]
MANGKKPYSLDRRRFLKASAGAVGGLSLAGCAGMSTGGGGGAGAGNVQGTPVAGLNNQDVEGKTNITVWFWDEGLKYAVQDYNKNNKKNVNVKFVKLSYDDTHNKLLTSLAAGSGAPDVCAIEIGQVGNFVTRGGLADLTTEFEGDQFKDDMVEYKWIHGSNQEGKLIAMPWDIGPAGMWYQPDVFKRADLPTEPEEVGKRVQTWEDVMQLGQDLRKKLPNTALFADAFNDIFVPIVEQKGHGWFQNNKLMFEEKGTPALQAAVEARKNKVDANIDWWGAEWNEGLKQGAFQGMMIASWMQTGLTQSNPQLIGKWRVVPPPEGNFNWGGSFLTIPAQGQNKEAAWDFVKYVCCTPEGQNAIFRSTGIFPAYKPAWKDPLYDQPVDFFGGQKTFRLWTELAQNVPANVVNPNDRQAGDVVGNEITKVEKQGKDPAQAMKDAEAAALKRIQGIVG